MGPVIAVGSRGRDVPGSDWGPVIAVAVGTGFSGHSAMCARLWAVQRGKSPVLCFYRFSWPLRNSLRLLSEPASSRPTPVPTNIALAWPWLCKTQLFHSANQPATEITFHLQQEETNVTSSNTAISHQHHSSPPPLLVSPPMPQSCLGLCNRHARPG